MGDMPMGRTGGWHPTERDALARGLQRLENAGIVGVSFTTEQLARASSLRHGTVAAALPCLRDSDFIGYKGASGGAGGRYILRRAPQTGAALAPYLPDAPPARAARNVRSPHVAMLYDRLATVEDVLARVCKELDLIELYDELVRGDHLVTGGPST